MVLQSLIQLLKTYIFIPAIFFFNITGCVRASQEHLREPHFFSGADATVLHETDQMVDVREGLRLHIHCVGNGEPSVILDAGLNQPGFSWALVQPKVAQFTRVCSYDRAGHGLSDLGKGPRTAMKIAEELHALLHAAKIPGPYVLVGHSAGGINIRMFTALYPQEVAGLVLVDPSHEDQKRLDALEWPKPSLKERVIQFFRARFAFIRRMIDRSIMRGYERPPNFSVEQGEYFRTLMMRTNHLESVEQEGESFLSPATLETLDSLGKNLGSRPLVIITAAKKQEPVADKTLQATIEQADRIMYKLHESITHLSQNSRLVLAKNSGHMVQWDEPELVVDAIREVCREFQKHR